MKKKIFVALLMSMIALTGCSNPVSYEAIKASLTTNYKVHEVYISPMIDYEIVYMPSTKILYVKYQDKLTPYLGEHGRVCRYVDGKIMEVDDE